eukprot:scaffold33059_cov65-Phaeocystis_antarctica.AAC.3
MGPDDALGGARAPLLRCTVDTQPCRHDSSAQRAQVQGGQHGPHRGEVQRAACVRSARGRFAREHRGGRTRRLRWRARRRADGHHAAHREEHNGQAEGVCAGRIEAKDMLLYRVFATSAAWTRFRVGYVGFVLGCRRRLGARCQAS